MRLKNINKTTYRKNLNKLIVAIIIALAVGSLAIAQLLITLFTDRQGSHFALNLTGVAVTAAGIAWCLNRFRHHSAMREIVYVWNLKQELNRIYRKSRKINAAIETGDKDAMTVLNFSHHGSKQLYQLDDNTVTLEDLEKASQQLKQTMEEHGYEISVEDYHSGLLKRF